MINLILKLMESEALKTAFLKLANMSISASWLVLAILVLRLVLKKAPKWVNVLLWGIVSVRLICPFTIESALSLIPSTQTIPMNIEMAAQPAIDSGVEVVNSMVNPMIAASFTPNPAASANPLQIWIPLIAVIWLFGMVLMFLYTAISYWRLNRRIDTAVLCRDNIFQSENVSSPFVLGIIKPKIYLPFHMNEQDLQHVVAHEQAHIRRRDHWWKPLGFLLLTLHWFNPLMWLAYVLLCRDIELACDEKVIKDLDNEQRADYTHALVACSVNHRLIAACPLAFGEVGVKDRVKSVMNYKKPSFWVITIALLVCAAVTVCFLTDPNPSREFSMTGNNISNLNPEAIVDRIVDIENITNSGVYTNPNNFSLQVDSNFNWAGEDSQAVRYFFSDSKSTYSGQLRIFPDKEKYLILPPTEKQYQESIFLLRHYLDAVKYLPQDAIRQMAPADQYILQQREEGRPSDYNRVITYSSEGVEDTDGWYIHLQIQPLHEEGGQYHGTGAEVLDVFYGESYGAVATPDNIAFGHYDLEGENAEITEVRLRNLHNGKDTVITNPADIQSIAKFFTKVKGANRTSSKGYYGGSYDVQLCNDSRTVLNIGFGDDDSFNCGDYGDGYPARYELWGVTREDVIRFFSQYDSSDFDWGLASILNAKLLEIHDGCFLVEPVEGSWELNSASRIEVPMKNMEPSPEPQVGDILEIEYNGQLQETYPARISNPYSIKVIEEAEPWDRIPMVMVNGELYLDTGKESTVIARCGMMDGEITSQVDGSKTPTVDNQSNFGTGYGYQYGAIEGTIEINMNGKWWIFATEEVRQEIQFPTEGTDMELMIDPIVPVTVVDLITEEQKFVNSNPSIRAIQSLIASEWWAEGNPSCDYDFKITVNDEDFLYHTDCGTFTDVSGDRCITLDETQQEAMDRLLSEANDVLDRYWLTIGADGVKNIEIKTAHSSGGCEHADGSLYQKGERIWVECLDGYLDLRGVSFTALAEDGHIIWQASIPDGEDNAGFTHLRNNDWNITNIPKMTLSSPYNRGCFFMIQKVYIILKLCGIAFRNPAMYNISRRGKRRKTMKRKAIFGAVITALICVCIALNAKILEPTDFTGAWYRTEDGMLYIFEAGIIECADKEIIVLDNTVFSGAYSFAKDKAAIFVVDDHGVGEVVELYLVHKSDGDVLCERKDGNEIVWFCRNKDLSIE